MARISVASESVLPNPFSQVEICPDYEYRSDQFVSTLIAKLNKLKREERKDALVTEMKKGILFIKSSDVVKIFQSVRFHRMQVDEVSRVFDDYLVRFTPKELAQIVKSVKKRLQPIVAIAFKNSLSSVTQESKELIYKEVQCDKYREDVKKAYQEIKPRSCVMGKMEKDVVFLIDLSGSMNYVFEKNGKQSSRITYLRPFITNAIQGFTQDVKFKIVTFATSAKAWKNEWIYATNQNKADAIKYVESKRPLGYTDTIGALKEAFKVDKEKFSILVFTDGMPTKGETNTKKILEYVKSENDKRVKRGLQPVKIHLNTVMLGGKNTPEENKEKVDTVAFCKELARMTGGTFKNFK